MKLAIGCDHRGYAMKKELLKLLEENHIEYEDYGCYDEERCDYPVYSFKVGEAVRDNLCDYGVLICGSGYGVCIAVNKVKKIRCVCLNNEEEVERAREHNNINVLALGSENTDAKTAYKMIIKMITTSSLKERHEIRNQMIEDYEKQ